jgi:uncharacterized protein YjbI with pentapeptide repeats
LHVYGGFQVSENGQNLEQCAVEESGSNEQAIEQQASEPVAPEKKSSLQYLASRPVKIETEADLKLVIERHQGWIASVLNPRAELMEGRANLTGSDLSGFDLSETDLRGVNFSRCILRGTSFQGSNLNGANFNHADLQGADIRGCSVRRTVFDYADLRDAELSGVDFSQASMSHVHRSEPTVSVKAEPGEYLTAELTQPEAVANENFVLQSEESISGVEQT